MSDLRGALDRLAARVKPYGPALIASAFLGTICVRAILAEAGRPALPLDDSFILLQYARRIAEGAPLTYSPGGGYTTGATSLLWPALLAPFHALGLRGLSLAYAAWGLGALAHAAVAVEAARLARPLAGRAAAAGAGAMCAAFGAFAWFAWSGMETVALAWILMRTARVAAAWIEPDARGLGRRAPEATRSPECQQRSGRRAPEAIRGPECQAGARTRRGAAELAVLGVAAPLIRPEGAIASVLAAAALAWIPPARGGAASARRLDPLRLLALAPLAGPLIIPAMHLAFAGHARSATATVKWLFGNPSYPGDTLWQAIGANVQLLLTDLLDGGQWTAIFLPEGSSIPLFLGAIALVVAAARRRRPVHAACVAAIALGTLLPCTYLSFLWNRVRYIWPFAPAWFVMLACLAREAGDLARCFGRSLTFVTPLLAGLFAGALAAKLPWAVRDLAQSASAIDRQQVWLGQWAAEHLPADAIVGVSDTGAIAYLGGRRTFDVVGLTTEGEARYWVAGAGSRFEHYEKLPPGGRPTHFIVYPHWMSCPPVLGEELAEATVTEQSILGGTTMVAYEARWDLAGTGAAPVRLSPGERVLDDIDVADLESEAAHGYELLGGFDQDNQAVALDPPESDAPGSPDDEARPQIADGGRFRRAGDRFVARLAEARVVEQARLVARVASDEGAELAVYLDEEEIGAIEVPAGTWVERSVALPPPRIGRGAAIRIALRKGASFHAFHYWITGR
ncbi:MAG: hypothetical protein IT372_17785 [Polyangiaceae bacterium]|nr:hypothetical protein [Polyangiaceae bacterium]